MLPETALSRVVDDEDAPTTDRIRALRMLTHPPLVISDATASPSPLTGQPRASAVPPARRSITCLRERSGVQEITIGARTKAHFNWERVGDLVMALLRKLLAKQKAEPEEAERKRQARLE